MSSQIIIDCLGKSLLCPYVFLSEFFTWLTWRFRALEGGPQRTEGVRPVRAWLPPKFITLSFSHLCSLFIFFLYKLFF